MESHDPHGPVLIFGNVKVSVPPGELVTITVSTQFGEKIIQIDRTTGKVVGGSNLPKP